MEAEIQHKEKKRKEGAKEHLKMKKTPLKKTLFDLGSLTTVEDEGAAMCWNLKEIGEATIAYNL